jgi:glyoxylase-like metal-dependent hydrolase (beta-lactamase superfamily II)
MMHPSHGIERRVTSCASVLVADNPGPMTLDGTNTWILRDNPERGSAVVVDPGPDEAAHRAGIIRAAGQLELILLTHRHADHSEGAAALAEATGAPVRSVDPTFRTGSDGLADGAVISAAGVTLRVLATPGHTADSVSVLLSRAGADPHAVLTGDTVLGHGTTVIAEPDGDLGAYLDSLRRLADLAGVAVLPGHGPELPDCSDAARFYLAHRAERLDQVREALQQRDLAPDESAVDVVVEIVYADVDRSLWPAARSSVRAQLRYLRDQHGR